MEYMKRERVTPKLTIEKKLLKSKEYPKIP